MNIEKYTDRAKGFLQAAQTIALREGNQQFTPEHLLKALLDDNEGMAAGLIDRAGGQSRVARVLRRRLGRGSPVRACLQAVVLRTARVRLALAFVARPFVMLRSVATARPPARAAFGRRGEKWDSNTVLLR